MPVWEMLPWSFGWQRDEVGNEVYPQEASNVVQG